MTDADVDGAHIRTLLLTFLYRYMKPLIEHGHVYIAQPPLYQIRKGKKHWYTYSDDELAKKLDEIGRDGITVQRYKGLGEMNPEQLWETTTDPEIIEVAYHPAFDDNVYIRPKVIIEVSGRSMSEPVTPVKLRSFIDEVFTKAPFTEKKFEVRAVLPQRTFLEKVFLLHEEFAKPKENIRIERMSRHLYDIGQMMDTPIAEEALQDKALYQSVIDHRRTFIGLRGFNYDTLQPATLRIVPPENIVEEWKKDYEVMQETMIYGDSLPFSQLIDKIRELNERINGMG